MAPVKEENQGHWSLNPHRGAITLLLSDALTGIGGILILSYVFYSRTNLALLFTWSAIGFLVTSLFGYFFYREYLQKSHNRFNEIKSQLWLYRFLLGWYWTIPQYMAATSGDPTLYVMPAIMACICLINAAYVCTSVSRYFAGFLPQTIMLLSVNPMLPAEIHYYAYLAIALGICLIPAAFSVERIYTDYLGASGKAEKYRSDRAQASQQIASIKDQLNSTEQRLQLVANHSQDIILLHDSLGRYVYVNKAVEAVLGYQRAEILGHTPSRFLHPEDRSTVKELFAEPGLKTLTSGPSRFRFIAKNGNTVWLESHTQLVPNGNGEDIALVSTSRDITANIIAEEKRLHIAKLDPLTKAYTRAEFDYKLKATVKAAKDSNGSHALLYLDLDQFKIINDSAGHEAGDALLKHVCQLLQSCTNAQGIVARLGGDEFAILLNDFSTNQATAFANQLRNRIAESNFHYNGQPFSSTVSIGIAVIDHNIESAKQALSRADIACYVAKNNGRNNFHLWLDGDKMVSDHAQNITLINQVKTALDNNQLEVYGQPVVPLQKHLNGVRHCEVLTAIQLENGERLSPDVYLPALETFGLSMRYDHHVIEAALKTFAGHAKGNNWRWISINLSAQTICHPPSLETIRGLFEQYKVSSENVCFEITETARLDNIDAASSFLQALKSMGCKLALDDFGSGHSSFEHLIKLPFDIMKIDGQFITDISTNPAHEALVKSMCEVASELGINTLAENVQDAATVHKLQSLGGPY
ncbi:MAG: EAL domain-containing protein, partial [Gammaproteobacteria bacterium]|nr:EAL domain-containing protein [Gammaproteobacteria bacterium]